RSDDMFIFRAVNIYPSHIDEIISKSEGIGSEYQIHLFRKESGKDHMLIKVERAKSLTKDKEQDKHFRKNIEHAIKKQIMVSCDVEMVDYGELPRSERKTKRVFDTRG